MKKNIKLSFNLTPKASHILWKRGYINCFGRATGEQGELTSLLNNLIERSFLDTDESFIKYQVAQKNIKISSLVKEIGELAR